MLHSIQMTDKIFEVYPINICKVGEWKHLNTNMEDYKGERYKGALLYYLTTLEYMYGQIV